MSVTIRQNRRDKNLMIRVERLAEQSRHGIRQGFYRLGNDLVKEARRSIIRGPKSGRLYRVPGRSRRHRASAPGQPPATLSGALQRTIDFQITGSDSMEFGSRPQPGNAFQKRTKDYAKHLELGTNKMQARPYLKPAVRKINRNGRKHFEAELARAHS